MLTLSSMENLIVECSLLVQPRKTHPDIRVGVIKKVIVINCNLITFLKVIVCNCN